MREEARGLSAANDGHNIAKPVASLRSQAFWLLAARVTGFAISTLLPLFLVRLLDRVSYGEYRQVSQFMMTVCGTMNMGMHMSAFYYLAREPQRARQVVFNISVWHAAMGAVVMVILAAYPQVLNRLMGSTQLERYAPAVGVVLFLMMASFMLESIATANQEVTLSTAFIIFANLTKAAGLIVFVWISPTIAAVLTALGIQSVVQSALLLWYLESRFPGYWRAFDMSFLREHLAYAIPLGLTGLQTTMQREIHHFFVSSRFGSAAYAVYAIGCFQLPLVAMVRDSIASVTIPRISELQKRGSHAEVIRLTASGTRQVGLATWPAIFFLAAFAPEFITALFTAQYIDAVPILRWNLLLLASVIPMTDPIFRAYAEHRYFIITARIPLLVLMLAGLYWGMEVAGMIGAVIIVVVTAVLERAILCWKAVRILGINASHWPLFRSSISCGFIALAAVVPVYLLRIAMGKSLSVWLVLCLCAGAYGLVYLALLITLGMLQPDERQMLHSVMGKITTKLGFADTKK
jgi:O-antigen/teichoic acid export membrane protein